MDTTLRRAHLEFSYTPDCSTSLHSCGLTAILINSRQNLNKLPGCVSALSIQSISTNMAVVDRRNFILYVTDSHGNNKATVVEKYALEI
jgi:hypothetical protein